MQSPGVVRTALCGAGMRNVKHGSAPPRSHTGQTILWFNAISSTVVLSQISHAQ